MTRTVCRGALAVVVALTALAASAQTTAPKPAISRLQVPATRPGGAPARPVESPSGTVERLWADMMGDNPAASQSALNALAARPADAIACVAAFYDLPADAESTDQGKLVRQLDAPELSRRLEAMDRLRLIRGDDPNAESLLLRYAVSWNQPAAPFSADARFRARDQLSMLGDTPTPELLATRRVVELLKAVATPEARQWLQRLADEVPLRRGGAEAREALNQLGGMPATVPALSSASAAPTTRSVLPITRPTLSAPTTTPMSRPAIPATRPATQPVR